MVTIASYDQPTDNSHFFNALLFLSEHRIENLL